MRRERPTAHSFPRTALCASASAVLLAAAGFGQTRPALPAEEPSAAPIDGAPAPAFDVRTLAAPDAEHLLFDEPGDGSLWARGADYKARFDARGATVIPFLGSDAPRNWPLAFEVASVDVGGAPLAAHASGTVLRDGNVVRIDHGSFVEEYELTARSLEQRFVFSSLPKAGDLRLRVSVATELERFDLGDSLRFTNERGHVDYSQAFVLDAAGRREALDSVLVDGEIELRVPQAFVERADFPLVVDPFVTFFTIASGPRSEVYPDVSYDASNDRWGVVWNVIFSETDYDAYVRLVTGDGTPLDTLTIDFTGDTWVTPAIANLNNQDLFLVCAAVVPVSGVADIRGRMVSVSPFSVGDVIQITPLDGAYRNFPDVGGDSYFGLSSNFCVVWQRFVTPNDIDIESRIVTATGALGTIRTLNTPGGVNLFPSISDAMGEVLGDDTEVWTVAWQHRHNLADNDIYAAQLHWTGTIQVPQFPIEESSWDETHPVVSIVLDWAGSGVQRPYMVVFERDFGSDRDLVGTVLAGSTELAQRNLIGDLDEEFWFRDQTTAAVASDGAQFLVAFEERALPAGPNPDVFVSAYDWVAGALVPCEVRRSFAGSPTNEGDVALSSMASSGGMPGRYFGVWNYLSANNGFDVQGGLWDGCDNGPGLPFCAGDNFGADCPCGNTGSSNHGCGNSAFPGGALLIAQGEPSIANDSLVLLCTDARPNQPALFFQGNLVVGDGAGIAFGDGLRCAGGQVVRLQVVSADAAGVATSSIGIAAHAGLAAGDLRYYQLWYRDPVGSPCGAEFNLSNGYQLTWQP